MLPRSPDERVAVAARPADEDQPRLRELEGQGGVEHVGRGQSVMDPAARLAHGVGYDIHEGGHLVLDLALAMLERLDVERGALAHHRGVLLRHHPLLGQGGNCRELHP